MLPNNVKKYKIYLRQILFALFILSITNNSAWAKPIDIADQEEMNRRAKIEAEERQQREQKKDVFLQSPIKDNEYQLPNETPSFPIKTIHLEGDSVEKFSWTKDILDKYTDRKIGKEGITIIVKHLTEAFIKRGYITTRVVVPEQDLQTGELHLVLIPGKIRDIRVVAENYKGTWRNAFPTQPGKLLNLRALEQGLEQMKRVPSQDVDFEIVPGPLPGESDIVIKLKQSQPYKASLSLDDSGSKATGKLQASTTIAVDNLFGINDLFNISLNNDAERAGYLRGTRGQSISYSVPYGYWTFTLSQNNYKYYQNIEGYNQDFTSSGDSTSTELRINRLINRSQSSKTSLQFGLTRKLNRSYIDDTEIEVQRKRVTIARTALQQRWNMGKTVIDAELACKWGVPWFNAQPDNELFAETNRYKIWTMDTSIKKPVTIDGKQAQYSLRLCGQTTKNQLFASEFFSIGNRYTVRGFDGEQTLSAEKGWYISNELAIPLDDKGQEMYLGLDYGRVYGLNTQYLLGDTLAGAVLGFRGKIKECNYDIFAGSPLKKPKGYKTDNITLGFNLVYQI